MRHWVTMTEIFHSFWSRQQFDKRSSDLISETHSRRWKLWPPLTPSSLISETYYKIPGPRMHLIFLKVIKHKMTWVLWLIKPNGFAKVAICWIDRWEKIFTLQKQTSFWLHRVWKSPKMSHLFLHFPRIFVQLKKIKSKVNVARFARNDEWDFFSDFQPPWKFSLFFFRPVFSNPKSIQASVTLLEKLPVILDKSSEDDMRHFVLPLLFDSLESKMSQIQVCTYRKS